MLPVKTPVAILCLLASACAYANIFETNETQRANLKVAASWGMPSVASDGAMWRRGLVADKASGTVFVLAEASLIGELSDRDYEAAFRTFAKPGDIAAALEWLGVPRGANVDSGKMQFWARGERVEITVGRLPAGGGTIPASPRPIQSYILDKSTGRAPDWESLVYCGSPDDPQSTNGLRLADTVAPNAILATYNEPHGLPRVKPLDVAFSVKEGKVVASLKAGAAQNELEIPRLLETFHKLTADGFDPHVTVAFGDDLTLLQATVLARLLDKCEKEGDIRVAPPPAGALYYKGFMPNDDWRSAKTRISQPWEAHIPTNGAPIRLVQTVEDWSDKNSLDPRLSTKEYSVATPEEAEKTITAGDAALAPNLRLQVALLFADKSAPLSAIMPTVRELLPTHPILYVFTD